MNQTREQEKTIQELLIQLAEVRTAQANCEHQHRKDRHVAVPPEVRVALEAVDAAYLPQMQALALAGSELEKQIKNAVATYGYTVKAGGYQAVWNKGRVTWQDDFLQGYATTHEEVLQARVESEPSVSIRRM